MEKKEGIKRDMFKEYIKFHNQRLDMEVNLFWQRSIFVSALLVIILTGYGALVGVMLKSCKTISSLASNTLFNSLASCICTIGILVSHIWFKITRGSMCSYKSLEDKLFSMDIREKFKNYAIDKELELVAKQHHLEDSFEFEEGPYSASILNIILTFLFEVVFSLLLCFHFVSLFFTDLFLFLIFFSVEMVLLVTFLLIVKYYGISWYYYKF